MENNWVQIRRFFKITAPAFDLGRIAGVCSHHSEDLECINIRALIEQMQ